MSSPTWCRSSCSLCTVCKVSDSSGKALSAVSCWVAGVVLQAARCQGKACIQKHEASQRQGNWLQSRCIMKCKTHLRSQLG